MGLLVSMNRYWSTREYCSKGHVLLPPAHSIEEGVTSIERILQKSLFCTHDVKELNHIYHRVGEFEKRADQLPERGSHYVLQLIVKKVQDVFSKQEMSAKNLIFLYQMQSFTAMGESIKKCFEKKSEQYSRSASQIEELANHLPCCVSSEHFERDLTNLLGPGDKDERTRRILNKKRKKLEAHVEKKEQIEKRKLELIEKRAGNPNQFPSFLDELLEYGHVRLFDHLLEMRALSTGSERKKIIEDITVSDLSHIVLETREALIRKVESSIPEGCNNFLFLLGGTSAGKSTTLSFLRGDKMRLTGDSTYESLENHNSVIGHDGTASCTFLPNIEIRDGLILVDFPGFSDTNGMLIALGAEFALKALIAKYNPKILVLESITNINDGYKAVKILRERLDRILGNKESCLLGITKYSKNDAFIKIQDIEKEQREELQRSSDEERELVGAINALINLGIPDLQGIIEAKKRELAELQQTREQQQLKDLPETPEKTGYRIRVQEIETHLLKETGLRQIVELSDLEDPNCLRLCLEAIAEQEQGALPPAEQTLSSDDKVFIEKRLSKDLKEKIKKEESYRDEFDSVKDFEQCVHDFSFVKSVFSHTHPEIGEFFHLPENDSRVVHEFDKQIAVDCINGYIKYTVSQIDIAHTRAVIKGLRLIVSDEKINRVEEKLNAVQNYIFGLLGVESTSEKEADAKWKEIQNQTKQAVDQLEDDIERELGWKGLTKFLACVPMGIPYGIHRYTVNQEKREQIKSFSQESANKYIDEEYQSLEQTHDSLIKLKSIASMIENQEEINKIFKSVPLVLNSMEELAGSVKSRINKIRALYGVSDWDVRVAFLTDKLRKNFSDIEDIYIPFFGDICIPSLLLHIEQDPDVDFIQIDAEHSDVHGVMHKCVMEKDCLYFRQKNSHFFLKQYGSQEEKLTAAAFLGIDLNKEINIKTIFKWTSLVNVDRGLAAITAYAINNANISFAKDAAIDKINANFYERRAEKSAMHASRANVPIALCTNYQALHASYRAFFDLAFSVAYSLENQGLNIDNKVLIEHLINLFAEKKNLLLTRSKFFHNILINGSSLKESINIIQEIDKFKIDVLEWIATSWAKNILDRKLSIKELLLNSSLDKEIIDKLLKIEMVAITDIESATRLEGLAWIVRDDQLDICKLCKNFDTELQDLDIDMQKPLSKALLAAAILKKYPIGNEQNLTCSQ